MIEEALYLMNPWWGKKEFEIGIHRKKYVDSLISQIEKKEIIFLTGLRRVGKTTIMRQIITDLLKQHNADKILYLTMDFVSFRGKSIHELINEFRKIHGHKISTKLFVFLDEVAQSPDFEIELKNFYDLEDIKIFASSSSSTILKSKNKYLVGRSRIIEIMPLDFEEFLEFRKAEIKKDEVHLNKKYFEDYLRIGGMPEFVLSEDIEYIKNTIEQIIYKDIVAVHNIKEGEMVERLFLLLCERTGKRISYSKLANILSISIDTIRRFISYFEDVFLFYTIERFAKTLNERTYSPKKIYIADNGIRTAFCGFKDKGSLMENFVFLSIKHLTPRFYYENEKEIDFIIKKGNELIAIEVKYKEEIDAKTIKFLESTKFKTAIVKNYEDLKELVSE